MILGKGKHTDLPTAQSPQYTKFMLQAALLGGLSAANLATLTNNTLPPAPPARQPALNVTDVTASISALNLTELATAPAEAPLSSLQKQIPPPGMHPALTVKDTYEDSDVHERLNFK